MTKGKGRRPGRPFRGCFMLLIKSSKKIINQDSYDDIVNNIDYKSIVCPYCMNVGFRRTGFYYRYLETADTHSIFRLKVLRVRCEACNRTHAVFVLYIIPYSRISAITKHAVLQYQSLAKALAASEFSFLSLEQLKRIFQVFKKVWASLLWTHNLTLQTEDLQYKATVVCNHTFMQNGGLKIYAT